MTLILLVACQAPPVDNDDEGVRVVPDSGGYLYGGITWTGDGGLIVSRATLEPPAAETRLLRLNATTGTIQEHRAPPPDDSCARIDEAAAHWDPVSEQVLWVRNCLKKVPGERRLDVLAAPSLVDDPSTLWSAKTRMPIRRLDVHDGTLLTSFGNVICETLARLTDAGVESLEIDVSGPGGTFSTDFDPSMDDCSGVGIAMRPATNAEGVLAFFASTEAIGRSGLSRLDARFDVYVRPTSGGNPMRLDVGLRSPSSIIWSPDSALMYVGGLDEDGFGTWRLDPETGDRTKVLPFAIGSPAWSSDGSQIVALRPIPNGDPGVEEVVVIDTARLQGHAP